MCNSGNITGGNPIREEKASPIQKITDVYIGVFFDGTNNNMLRSAKEKINQYRNKLKKIEDKKNKELKNQVESEYKKADKIFKEHSVLETDDEWEEFIISHLSPNDKCNALKKGGYDTCKNCKESNKLENCKNYQCKVLDDTNNINNWIKTEYNTNRDFWGKDAIRQFKNAHTTYQPTKCGGFSNVAILYSAYNPNPENEKASKTYKIYIEGAGATDISEISKMNINGLGFGLGETGVVALVSKAVYYVNNYIESIKSTFQNETVNIHFNVFGFSRGATCSRLFSNLVTRGAGESLGKREKEFADFYAKKLYFKEGKEDAKLHFLEDPNYNKTVDFLGIYDTVVSIGFLLQKDGYVNPLALGYKNKITGLHADNYIANWHCNNVSEYGMYCTSKKYNEEHKGKIKNILHICAMDEYRENFALTNVGETVGNNAVEIYIPGCHSDVGGGYYDGDEEQEIILRKSVQKGKCPTTPDWEKRRTTKNIFGYNAHLINPCDKKVYWGKCHYQKSDDKSFIDASEMVFGKELTEKAIKNNFYLASGLKVLGWIDENWDNYKKRKRIELNGDPVPCTIRITDGPKYFKFKRNVKAGYSNIPLKMMIKYAESKLVSNDSSKTFSKLFNEVEKEYPIPGDLVKMAEDIISQMEKIETEKRYWMHPDDSNYKDLRTKYLHFTSTYRLYHTNNPFAKDVKTFEGSPGNIANTPNQDLDGRICRIVYNGDKDDYDLNYLYEYGENLGNVHGNIPVKITFASDTGNKD